MGICLHRAGAASVLLTDADAQTLCNLTRNLEKNGVPLMGQVCSTAGASLSRTIKQR